MGFLARGACLFVWIFLASSIHAADLTQERWIELMTKNMPALFCKSDQYYRNCYEVTQEECEDTAAFAVEVCIANHLQELPDIFTYADSRQWGAVVEKCVDQEYTRTFSGLKKDTEECKEIK